MISEEIRDLLVTAVDIGVIRDGRYGPSLCLGCYSRLCEWHRIQKAVLAVFLRESVIWKREELALPEHQSKKSWLDGLPGRSN